MTFEGRLYKNENSQNVLGVDIDPRMYVVPMELKEVLQFTESSESVSRGFWHDMATGLFLRNVPNYTRDDAAIDFIKHKNSTPYSMRNTEEYNTRMMFWTGFNTVSEMMWSRAVDAQNATITQVNNKLSYVELDFVDFLQTNTKLDSINISDRIIDINLAKITIKEL